MTSSYKPRVSYYYDSDVGSFHYGTVSFLRATRGERKWLITLELTPTPPFLPFFLRATP
jgi:hypothetical protein